MNRHQWILFICSLLGVFIIAFSATKIAYGDEKVSPEYSYQEVTVIKHTPGAGKYDGKLGSLVVELEDGRQFKVGTGFSMKDRTNPPPIGSKIRIRHKGYTKSKLPRYASYQGVVQ